LHVLHAPAIAAKVIRQFLVEWQYWGDPGSDRLRPRACLIGLKLDWRIMPLVFRKARVFWPLIFVLVLSDCATKRWAEANLSERTPEPVVGEVIRWTLAYNDAGAMGISFGSASRPLLILATLVVFVVLVRVYRDAAPRDARIGAATALVLGGAIGNLIDRVRWNRGVVDFIDVGIGDSRFWIFNVADVGVTVGAALLGWYLWHQEDPRQEPV
jgi:signal peptidase II